MTPQEPKQSRTELDLEYEKAIATVDAKLEAFVAQHEKKKLQINADFAVIDNELSEFIARCEKEKSDITENYLSNIKKSDDPTPPPFSSMEPGQGNLGNYD